MLTQALTQDCWVSLSKQGVSSKEMLSLSLVVSCGLGNLEEWVRSYTCTALAMAGLTVSDFGSIIQGHSTMI